MKFNVCVDDQFSSATRVNSSKPRQKCFGCSQGDYPSLAVPKSSCIVWSHKLSNEDCSDENSIWFWDESWVFWRDELQIRLLWAKIMKPYTTTSPQGIFEALDSNSFNIISKVLSEKIEVNQCIRKCSVSTGYQPVTDCDSIVLRKHRSGSSIQTGNRLRSRYSEISKFSCEVSVGPDRIGLTTGIGKIYI